MSQNQDFEKESGTQPPAATHSPWQSDTQNEPEINTKAESRSAMTWVNHRLSALSTPPFSRTLTDVGVWSVNGFLFWIAMVNLSNYVETPLLCAASISILALLNLSLQRQDLMQAALSLQEYDKRWIGPLFEALAWPNRRIRQIVALKLRHLLPLMQESDLHYLTPKHRSLIVSILLETHDRKLQVAILKVLHLFGDVHALHIVNWLAARRAWTPGNLELRDTARACLPRLRHRLREEAERPTPTPSATFSEAPQQVQETQEPTNTVAETSPDRSALTRLEREREKVARPSVRAVFLIADWCIIVPYCLTQAVLSFRTPDPFAGCVWSAIGIAASQLYRVSLSPSRVAMIRRQAQQRDIKGVGALAEALTWPERESRYLASSALTILLPQLKASDASLLNPTQRECLHQFLKLENAQEHSDLMIAILKAFQQVGDNAAIPYVAQLAAATPNSPLENRVVQEAKECLPYLHLCAQNNTSSHTLLRASSQSDATPETALLRPAREHPESRPEQLLRPTDNRS